MPERARSYDWVVIGGGPAGIFGATNAAVLGKSVALVDDHHELGGAGTNTGTVPSKTLRETALALSGLRSRNLYGVDLSLRREATIGDFLRHERNVKEGLNALASRRLESYRVDVHCGRAAFVDPHTVRVSPRKSSAAAEAGPPVLLQAPNILIATGSRPVRPAIFPFGPSVYDSDTILDLQRLPTSLAVVGAGVIGSEYACTFAALGIRVHVIDGRDTLLSFADQEISQAVTAAMANAGIEFHWKQWVKACSVQPGSPQQPGRATLTLDTGQTLSVEAVLIAAGRRSNVESLNLPAAGVKVGERGLVAVDERYRTNVPHIFAAGDVIGFPALASTSMEQARLAVRHAMGLGAVSTFPKLLPHGIFTIPEIGMVGDTEESLRKKGIDYVVGRARYRDSARGRIIGEDQGFLKLLFQRGDLKLLGVHIMGEEATEIVHIGLMAMLAGGTAELLDGVCFNLPTLGELYKFATFDAMLQAARLGATPSPFSQAPEPFRRLPT